MAKLELASKMGLPRCGQNLQNIMCGYRMNVSDNIQTRVWSKLKFYDPELILQQLRIIENQVSRFSICKSVSALRTKKLKKYKEGREAALLCYGIGKCVLGTTVFFSPEEDSDYDFVAKWRIDDIEHYAPVQLKEWTPVHLNQQDKLVDIIKRLNKYTNSRDTIFGIYLNRSVNIDFSDLIIPDLSFAGIWLFGFNSHSGSWFVYGDVLSHTQYLEFNYP